MLRDEYRKVLEQHLQDRPHKDDGTCKQNWDTLIVAAAEEPVGRRNKHPEWFEESLDSDASSRNQEQGVPESITI